MKMRNECAIEVQYEGFLTGSSMIVDVGPARASSNRLNVSELVLNASRACSKNRADKPNASMQRSTMNDIQRSLLA